MNKPTPGEHAALIITGGYLGFVLGVLLILYYYLRDLMTDPVMLSKVALIMTVFYFAIVFGLLYHLTKKLLK